LAAPVAKRWEGCPLSVVFPRGYREIGYAQDEDAAEAGSAVSERVIE